MTLNLIAVGYSLGLAASVLYLGALGDRYGRKLMLLLGTALAIPMSLLAAFAPSDDVLFAARVGGGVWQLAWRIPTTLALIAALWFGPARTKADRALVRPSAVRSRPSARFAAGALLEEFWWGSVFLITLPLAGVALVLAFLPGAEPRERDRPTPSTTSAECCRSVHGGCADRGDQSRARSERGSARARPCGELRSGGLSPSYLRQRRAKNPLYDLGVASRRVFWVAAAAGIIVFGSLMGAAFISQQYLQNVLDYSTFEAGTAILPAAVFMVLVAPRSAKLVEARGARFTLLLGYVALFLAFLTMLLVWKEDISYWQVALAYVFIGIGVGLAGTPASHSLTGSVPVTRAGMASGTADLQRDLGGAIMTSVFGALLTAGYASAFSAAIAGVGQAGSRTASRAQLTKSFAGAEAVAEQYPQYADQITAAAKTSFLQGDQWAYTAGLVAVVLGAALVFFMFPKKEDEERLLAEYHEIDTAARAEP